MSGIPSRTRLNFVSFGISQIFYKPEYDDETFNDSDDEQELEYFSCGKPMKKYRSDGMIIYECEECGEMKSFNQSKISGSKSYNAKSAPMGGYVKTGKVTRKKRCYAIPNSENYNARVRKETVEMILAQSEKTGIYVSREIAYAASIEYNKIRKTEIHRGAIMRGLIGACIMHVSEQKNISCQRAEVLKLLEITSNNLSSGESILTNTLYHFNMENLASSIKNSLTGIFNKFSIPKKHISFLSELIQFCHKMYISINSNDFTMCVGAVWFMLCYGDFGNVKCRENDIVNIKEYHKKLNITANTFNKFIDCLRLVIWRKPLPNTKLKPERYKRMDMRQRQLCVLLLRNNIKLVRFRKAGRYKKYFAEMEFYDVEEVRNMFSKAYKDLIINE